MYIGDRLLPSITTRESGVSIKIHFNTGGLCLCVENKTILNDTIDIKINQFRKLASVDKNWSCV